ncbi:MAG TPA: NADH-quinone oxidoreductase subunit L [Candidatus Limnocylindrales bacterium]|nr:NADH-quinone oxidoreductase subunit L [Candidatus Limnocylindrales bacterium]
MTEPSLNLWVIPLLPLAGAAINGLFGRHLKKAMVSFVALLFTAASFGYAVWAVVQGLHMQLPHIETLPFPWIVAGSFSAPFGFYLDQLSMVMLMVVTGVGFLIHIYSVGYMAHEGGYYRFFSYLNLFMFFMLTLVLANNYLLMFVGWEGVGLASYLLIGFFFLKDSAADAGKKAFIVNRIGDFAFLIGMFLMIQHFGTLNFGGDHGVFAQVSKLPPEAGWGLLTAIALCLMFGATGKSAQVPLYVWLPDAMEGPTPVSALIHAATMVTAGIYMIARSNVLFSRAPHALEVVALIGGITAIFAATMGMAQTDIKRVLAYSTVSQLGYMFLACGVAAYSAAIFHLMTHAFFKALLFLGAGSVIHALGGEQDMRRMGGLRKLIPRTHFVMLMATLAISGIPPFAGFFSKDEILGQVFSSPHGNKVLWAVGVITAGLTAFYMFRLYFMTFYGELRLGKVDVGEEAHAAPAPAHAGHAPAAHSHGHADDQAHGHGGVHESPWIMMGPLMVLALLSIIGGWVGVPAFMGGGNRFEHFLAPVIQTAASTSPTAMEHVSEAAGQPAEEKPENTSEEWTLAGTSVAVALLGFFFAWLLYYKQPGLPDRITSKIHGIYLTVLHKYYVDEGYGLLVVKPLLALSTVVFWRGVDQGVIDGLVNGAGSASKGIGGELRRMQSGNIRSYAAWIAAGGAAVIAYMIWLGVGK